MTKLKRTLKAAFMNRFAGRRMSDTDRYLSNATSLEDLERRQRELMSRGL